MAEKEEKIEVEGEVLESFRAGMYRIGLENGHETLGVHLRQDAPLSHPYRSGRQGEGRAFAVRPEPRTHHV